MMKEKMVNVCDMVIEWSFYILLVGITFSTSVVEIAASLMILAGIMKKIYEKDTKWWRITSVKMLFLLLGWVILSCVNTKYPSESFRGIFKVVEYSLIFIIMATNIWEEKQIKRFLYVIVGSVMLMVVNGIYQYFIGEGFIRHRTLIPEDYLHRISSSFIHPNDFGVYLLVVCTILIALLLSKSTRMKDKTMFFISLVASSVCLFLTRSRGAWLSFSASFLVLGATKTKRLLATFLALLLVIFLILPYSVQERIFSLTDVKSGTTWERVMLWKGTINMIKVHPILGFGVNTYSRNFPKYKPGEYPDVRYSHNCYLHMASEIGIVGALIFLIFLVTVFVYVLRGIFLIKSGLRKDVSIGLFAGLIGFTINSMVDTHLYSVNLAVFFHLLLGFCFSLVYHDEKDRN